MSDETTRFDAGSEGTPGPGTTAESTTGFCQDCGKPLTATTARPVGSAVFCEPCLQTRLAKQPTATGYTPGYVPAAGPSSEPNPALAGWLGLIPGVGAMYNGQYGKGIIHLAIFAVLVSFANHVDNIFGLFVAAWIFYGSFEAYHTARARRDGMPVPNAFGLNDIGDRMGFGKNWPAGTPRPVGVPVSAAGAAAGAATQAPPPVATAPSTGWTPVNQNPVQVAPPPAPVYPDWVGYVPPAAVSPYAAIPYTTAPYAPPSAGYAQVPPAAPYEAYVPPVAATDYAAASSGRSFPVIAIILIVLGALFALANFVPNVHINGSWLVAILLGLFAALAFARRMGHIGGVSYRGNLICAMRGPIMLAVLAVLFLLQAVHAATLGQTWPVILVALGAILLLERTLGTSSTLDPVIPYAAAAPYATAPPVQDTTRSEVNSNEVEKGGL